LQGRALRVRDRFGHPVGGYPVALTKKKVEKAIDAIGVMCKKARGFGPVNDNDERRLRVGDE